MAHILGIEEIYTYFEKKTTQCYIKPQNYERSKTKKFKSNMALRENMFYDKILDEYTCQGSKSCALCTRANERASPILKV